MSRRVAPLVLALVLASVWAAADSRADALEEPPELVGVWKLERREDLEEYLKASGTPWWKRKLALLGSSRLRQTIAIAGDRVTVHSENPVETRTLEFVADGVTETSAEAASGDRMTWTAHIDGGVFVIDGHGDLGHRIIRREVVGGEMVMTIENPDADARCRLFFERMLGD